MNYLGQEIPKLGFGLMRLPRNSEGIDIELVKKMVDRFLSAGFTYFDTAYLYPGSEEAIKKALVERHPREKYQLATKLPAWAGAKTFKDAKEMFETSLERTGAGYFDYYLLHNCGDDRTKVFDELGLWDYALELKQKGLIKHVGFSMHDSAATLDDLLTKHPEMEFVQLQINYADWENLFVQSRLCYEMAMKHKKPVIIMEPVKGGLLSDFSPSVAEIFKKVNPELSVSSWALRFAASLENLITVLSGMSNMEQLEDNIKMMSPFVPLNEKEQQAIAEVRAELDKIPSIPCTSCRYCVKDCPADIGINNIFESFNRYLVYGDLKSAKNGYGWAVARGGKASDCLKCGNCESVCPQQIKIMEKLEEAAALLEK